jgi:hypothetical protein
VDGFFFVRAVRGSSCAALWNRGSDRLFDASRGARRARIDHGFDACERVEAHVVDTVPVRAQRAPDGA